MVCQTLNEGQNSSKSHKNKWPGLSLKWVSKSTLKFQFRESWKKRIFWTLLWTMLKEGQNSFESHKNMSIHAYMSNRYLNLLSKRNSENVDKSAYFQTWFDYPWTREKVAPNLIKIGVAYLSNGYLNQLSKLNSNKGDKSAYFQPWFDQSWTRSKATTNLIKYVSMLISQMCNKIHFQNSISRTLTIEYIFNVGLTNLEWGPK